MTHAARTSPTRFTVLEEPPLTPARITTKVNEFNDHAYARITSPPITPEGINLDDQ